MWCAVPRCVSREKKKHTATNASKTSTCMWLFSAANLYFINFIALMERRSPDHDWQNHSLLVVVVHIISIYFINNLFWEVRRREKHEIFPEWFKNTATDDAARNAHNYSWKYVHSIWVCSYSFIQPIKKNTSERSKNCDHLIYERLMSEKFKMKYHSNFDVSLNFGYQFSFFSVEIDMSTRQLKYLCYWSRSQCQLFHHFGALSPLARKRSDVISLFESTPFEGVIVCYNDREMRVNAVYVNKYIY